MGKKTLFIMILAFVLSVFPKFVFAGTAYLDIVSQPDGVDVYINGKHVGKTPLTGLSVPSGSISLKAIKKGYGSASHSFRLKPDEVKSIKIPLRRTSGKKKGEITVEQDMGSLLIINQLGPVAVYIDGSKKGTGSMSIAEISTGYHDLKSGSFQKRISIYKNYKLKVRISKNGISILNDLEEINRKKKLQEEKRRKEARRKEIKEERAKVEQERARIEAEKDRKERKRREEEERKAREKAIFYKEMESDGRFVRYGSGIIRDTQTGLEWYVYSTISNVDWNQIKSWAESLDIDGGGWRLPTLNELEAISKTGKGRRNISQVFSHTGKYDGLNKNFTVWSGEKEGSKHAWFYFFFRKWHKYKGYHYRDIACVGRRGFAVRSK